MSTLLQGVRNIIFDFGGVLFEIDYDAPVRAFRELGFVDFDKIYAQAAQSEVFDKMETGKMEAEEFYQYIEQFCPNATREQVVDAWNLILLHVMPEQLDLVQKLSEEGYRIFLLSNTNAIHVAEFERMMDETIGIDRFRKPFEKIYYSNEIGLKKPYPETYLQLCEWNGLIPSETLFIDDSLQHVEGARKAGLKAFHLKAPMRLTEVF